MNDPREILKQADRLEGQKVLLDKFLDNMRVGIGVPDQSTQPWRISVGSGWCDVPLSAIIALRDACQNESDRLTDAIWALEARVQVVES